ncbi:DEAD/DEAH box helicase [Mangrovimonas sp. YM274]|uniref:DEAD/DEAH box helicase n=1 Tax=Mangrovimonas sp. YM274 TaxID=3070660 RepID=UPI0027DBA15E|nr:SNF2-related protein [Mangrovimonas sp. YM274]WMI70082.1 SNF2-related protein [Mangrovimonas sp. YM274]
MAKYQIGDPVIHVNSKEKGIIVEVCPPARGRQLYRVNIDNSIKNCLESNLIPDTDLTNPFERLRQGIFGTFQDFAKLNTSFKIKNTSNNTISSLKASNTIFKAYQFKPLLKFINSENRRILVADEVGLGKTIEAGHIMLELMARREMGNALIVCPKSLQEKWQLELKEKFNFHFKIYESSKDLVEDIQRADGTIKAIVNYEKIRLPKSINNKKPSKTPTLFELLERKNIKFDFMLCDEAHRLRNHTTQTHKGTKKIIEHANAVVFLTATPIMISEQNLFYLLQLLDEHKYTEYSTFHNEIAVNRPFVKALTQINKHIPFSTIAHDLENAEVSLYYSSGEEHLVEWEKTSLVKDLFKDIPLYQKIITDLKTKNDLPKTRVQLQFDISDMSELNKVFSRTRKKEVTQDWSQAVREPQTKIVELYPQERYEFDAIIEEYIDENTYIDDHGVAKMTQGGALGLIQKKRQVASSVYAYLNGRKNLDKGIDTFENAKDAKFEQLLEIINHVVYKEHKKLIVFALFKNTLKYLHLRLRKEGIKTVMIHGDVDDRISEINQFKNDDTLQILLSSEVGSEGLDMQFCDALVNYDLPWNPMVVEQRIGRIDRFGQNSPIVNIYNLVVKNSIQEDIYTRLLDRIGIFRGCIGDLEAILDKDLDRLGNIGVRNIREWFSSLEKELYCKEISEKQRKEKIDAIERAIITEQRNLEKISEGLTDSLTNDIYFKNEIESIQNNHRYVTEKELVNYVKTLIRTKLTTCELTLVDEDQLLYTLTLPKSSPKALINFLTAHQTHDTDTIIAFKRFTNAIQDKTTLTFTFSQETGYNNKELIRINAYHPIVIAAMHFFDAESQTPDNTFQLSLDKQLLKNALQTGDYFLAVYSTTIIKKWFKGAQKTEHLVPILFNIQENEVIKDKNLSEQVLGEAQLHATAQVSNNQIPKHLITDLEYILAEEIDLIDTAARDEQKMRMETHKIMQTQRKTEFYDNRINRQKNIIKNSENKLAFILDEQERKNIESILPAQRKNLQNLEVEKEQALEEINASELLYKTPKLLSLNHITIY